MEPPVSVPVAPMARCAATEDAEPPDEPPGISNNEAHGVLLDDPTEAWGRAYGTPVPVTFDIEWYAAGEPQPLDRGYRQDGEVDVQVELTEGVLSFSGPGERVHVWGAPYLPTSFAMPHDTRGVRAPYRRSDGLHIDQVLATSPSRGSRWWVNR
jgi:hypothetical protein